MNTKIIVRYAIRESMGALVMAVGLFWAAGTLRWWPAWAILAATLAWSAATAIVILHHDPSLLAERLGPRKGGKTWDAILLGILGITQLGRYIFAGLDQRYGWTGGFPLWVQLAGLALCILGYGLFIWAEANNAFFSQMVRIQSERGHRTVSSGPYRYVRHPAYAGAAIFELAAGMLLASWPALIIGGANVGLLILRTALEDRTLQAELPGYSEYSGKVRYRLIRGIW